MACQRDKVIAIRCSGGLLEWDMWIRIHRSRLARPHKYASIGPQISLSRVPIEPPHRHQQTIDRRCFTGESLNSQKAQNRVRKVGIYLAGQFLDANVDR
jgi:hypothetical protein